MIRMSRVLHGARYQSRQVTVAARREARTCDNIVFDSITEMSYYRYCGQAEFIDEREVEEEMRKARRYENHD